MIKIHSNILLEIIALKGEGESECVQFAFKREKAAVARVVTNEEHSNEF